MNQDLVTGAFTPRELESTIFAKRAALRTTGSDWQNKPSQS